MNSTIKRIAKREASKMRSDIYDDVAVDVTRQTLACCLLYLEKRYGFKKKRLTNVIEGIESMMTSTFFEKEMNPVEVIEYLKETYDIDLDRLRIEVKDENNNVSNLR